MSPTSHPPPRWRLDEVASAGRENLDAAHVARYDDKQDADAAGDVELLRRFGLDERSVVVDLGAGTGQFTLAVASVCAAVVAVDVSPVMISRLRANVAAAGANNVRVVEAGFLDYDHQGAAADIVYSRWALHHLPDLWKAVALARMRQILRPGGVLRLSDIAFSFDPADIETHLERWCATLPDVGAADAWARRDIEEHVRDEYSTFTWLLEPMIERCGFRIEHTDTSADGVFADYVARAE